MLTSDYLVEIFVLLLINVCCIGVGKTWWSAQWDNNVWKVLRKLLLDSHYWCGPTRIVAFSPPIIYYKKFQHIE